MGSKAVTTRQSAAFIFPLINTLFYPEVPSVSWQRSTATQSFSSPIRSRNGEGWRHYPGTSNISSKFFFSAHLSQGEENPKFADVAVSMVVLSNAERANELAIIARGYGRCEREGSRFGGWGLGDTVT
mmetsp:Transcript_13044/g.26450  ORF Transcript_13044/g.26450 Transcript_13044/m.26450 type:complete len:128 (-) Transcript_13044:1304-1687(-)